MQEKEIIDLAKKKASENGFEGETNWSFGIALLRNTENQEVTAK